MIIKRKYGEKVAEATSDALGPVDYGATVLVSGFGNSGTPDDLLDGLLESGAAGLTIVSNNVGDLGTGVDKLLGEGRVGKVICSYPRQKGGAFRDLYRSREVELELVPQGTLVERIRAGGAGLGGVYTPTGANTDLRMGLDGSAKATRVWEGRLYMLEDPIRADLALVKAEAADKWGNLVYRKASRNYGPIMAMAARRTVASVRELRAEPIDPELVVTPGIFVDSILIRVERELLKEGHV